LYLTYPINVKQLLLRSWLKHIWKIRYFHAKSTSSWLPYSPLLNPVLPLNLSSQFDDWHQVSSIIAVEILEENQVTPMRVGFGFSVPPIKGRRPDSSFRKIIVSLWDNSVATSLSVSI